MKVLLAANHYAVASGRYALNALRRMGHEVYTIGEAMGPHIWGLTVDERYIWTPEPPPDKWQPDVVLVMDSALSVKHDASDGSAPCPVVCYGVDNHVRDYRHMEFDHLFLAHGHGARIGEANVTWLPCAYDPTVFKPGRPWDEREFDAALVAVMYGPRAELVYAMLGVPDIKLAYGTGPLFEEFAGIYQNSRVSVVRSANQDVAQRVWETAACGCLVLMDACPDCEALGLEDGKNCLIYASPEEAVYKLRWALVNPDKAEKIAKAGQKWAQDGTWDARLQVIIEWVEGQVAPKKREKAGKGE